MVMVYSAGCTVLCTQTMPGGDAGCMACQREDCQETMPRRFNVAGPCKPEIHYMLPAAARVPLARRLVADQNYFVIHAPRQSGKTTAMTSLAQELTAVRRVCGGARLGRGRRSFQ